MVDFSPKKEGYDHRDYTTEQKLQWFADFFVALTYKFGLVLSRVSICPYKLIDLWLAVLSGYDFDT